MTELSRPGVYVREVLAPTQVEPTADSAFAGCFLGALDRGPTEPTPVASWFDFTKTFGGFNSSRSNETHYAVFSYFLSGGVPAWIQRVTGAGDAASTLNLEDGAGTPLDTLQVDASSTGAWGDDVYVEVVASGGVGRFTLAVYYGGTAAANSVETWTDLSMDTADARYAPTVLNHLTKGSAYVTVTDLFTATAAPDNMPSDLGPTALAGGADGAAVVDADRATALSSLDTVNQPLMLTQDSTTVAAVNTAIAYAEGRGSIFVVTGTPEGSDVAAALTFAGTLTQSSFGAAYYPRVHFSDPNSSDPGAIRLLNPAGAIIGRTLAVDKQRTTAKAPAGLTVSLPGAVALERSLTDADLDSLNASHLNAIRNMRGAGVVLMGARTLKRREADKFIPVRRTLIYLRDALTDLTNFAVFEPNGEPLWADIERVCGQFLAEFWQRGGLRGGSAGQAFYVKCDAETNPQNVIDNGEVRVEVGAALLQPAEFVVITIGQTQGN